MYRAPRFLLRQLLLLTAAAALLPPPLAAGLRGNNTPHPETDAPIASEPGQHATAHTAWQRSLLHAMSKIQHSGAGGYSTADTAHEALHAAFRWDSSQKRLQFDVTGARPSFCSGAVYAAILSALMQWDAAQPRPCISEVAWRTLQPRPCADGETPWGYANANGAGFALLIHRLGAGYSFTDLKGAQCGDVLKIWWTNRIGGSERGHLVIFIRDLGEQVRVWSSHVAQGRQAAGFGLRDIPKSKMARCLITRITDPSAFNKAPLLPPEPWLTQQLQHNVSWRECVRRCSAR